MRVRTGFRSGLAIHASELCETSRLGVSSLVPTFLRRRLHCPIPAETGKVLEFVNTVMYAEAILDAGRGGRVVPGRWPWATRPTLPSAKIARSQRDGAALRVLRRCAGEESPSGLSVADAPCTTPIGAPTYVTVFTKSSTKMSLHSVEERACPPKLLKRRSGSVSTNWRRNIDKVCSAEFRASPPRTHPNKKALRIVRRALVGNEKRFMLTGTATGLPMRRPGEQPCTPGALGIGRQDHTHIVEVRNF